MKKKVHSILVFLLAAGIFISGGNQCLCLAQEEHIQIPPNAHEKAVQALKILGPQRGAKTISFRVVDILGVSKGLSFDSRQLAQAIKDLGAKETQTEVQIEMAGDVLFDFDKWNIRPEAEQELGKVGTIIKAYASPKIIISGHTDSKGSEDYNMNLSLKRAESVKNWLVKNAGADATLIETIGCGESKPVAANTNPDGSDNSEGRKKNRRVEILVKK